MWININGYLVHSSYVIKTWKKIVQVNTNHYTCEDLDSFILYSVQKTLIRMC